MKAINEWMNAEFHNMCYYICGWHSSMNVKFGGQYASGIIKCYIKISTSKQNFII